MTLAPEMRKIADKAAAEMFKNKCNAMYSDAMRRIDTAATYGLYEAVVYSWCVAYTARETEPKNVLAAALINLKYTIKEKHVSDAVYMTAYW